MPPSWNDVGEGSGTAIIIAAVAWVSNQLRRTTKDVESRATRTVDRLEKEMKDLKDEHRAEVFEMKEEIKELRAEVEQCHEDRQAETEERARLRLALIQANIPIPEF